MDTLTQLKQGQLKGRKELHLNAGLTEFPQEILTLADSLELLDLSNNHLQVLPDSFSQLKNLKAVFLNNNAFTCFPNVLASCPSLQIIGFKNNQISTIGERAFPPTLRWLILTNNLLRSLPDSIGQLSKLQKLMLAGNKLQILPQSLSNCHNLQLIRLAANQLTELPTWLFTLPKLSWLAYSGNRFHQTPRAASDIAEPVPLPIINRSELDTREVLGEGASGVICKGKWMPKTSSVSLVQPQTVAIKQFKGDMTSDGSPMDEMQACIAAGRHPNLVNVLGKYVAEDESEKQVGLVFSFIPSDYCNLGNPPSLETCTRDTYGEGTRFSAFRIVQICKGIASVMEHLHRRGINHGDLYAHNILVNPVGHSILGDFGAASFYDRTHIAQAAAIERLEVRAFGCLLEDLLNRAELEDISEKKIIEKLLSLQKDCQQTIPLERPLFEQICQRLCVL